MATYETPYTDTLDSTVVEIRSLVLHPAPHREASIECHTERMTLSESAHYEALSYVWGDPKASEHITFNGLQWPVSANLADALHQLRRQEQPRRLWIDALSINQADIQERNSQVAIMGDIYRLAAPVMIYLGSKFETGDEILEMMQNIPTNADLDEATHSKIFGFYYEISSQPWFKRLWTVQELVLGKDEPIIVCGTWSMPWSRLYAVLSSVAGKEFKRMGMLASYSANKEAGLTLTGLKMDIFNDLRLNAAQKGNESLRKLLLITKGCAVSEPRDRIYALLGMMSDENRKDILVDYSMPLGSVYAQALSHIFKTGEGPFFLSGTLLTGLSGDAHMPSWIPQFGQEFLLKPTKFHPPFVGASGSGSQAVNGVVDDDLRTLRVRGMFVDKVLHKLDFSAEVTSRTGDLRQVVTMAAYAGQLAQIHGNQRPYLRELKTKEPIWRTLIANRRYDAKERAPAPGAYGEVFGSLLSDEPPADDPALEVYKYCLRNYMSDNCFFVTETGFCGIAPNFTESGDTIAIIFGAPTPFVLRPTAQLLNERRDAVYVMLGVAYVGGIMDGEMVDEVYCEDLEDDITFVVR